MGKFHEHKHIKNDGDILAWGLNPECDVTFYDNCVTQQDIVELSPTIAEKDVQELADEIQLELAKVDPDMRGRKALFPEWMTIRTNGDIILGPDDEKDMIVIVHWVEGWNKNWGAEMIWYEEGEPGTCLATTSARVVVTRGPCPVRVTGVVDWAERELKYFVYRVRG